MKQPAVRITFFRFWIAHIFFLSKISSQTKVSIKCFTSEKAACPGGRYSGEENPSTQLLKALIVWEPSALSNASNAELVLLGVQPQPERWTSAGHSLSASSCYWSGKIRNKLAEPGQLLRWPNPGKIPCLGNIINWVWSQGLAGALVRAWICGTAWDSPIAAEGSWGITRVWLVKTMV